MSVTMLTGTMAMWFSYCTR